jgi:hypothetical protein
VRGRGAKRCESLAGSKPAVDSARGCKVKVIVDAGRAGRDKTRNQQMSVGGIRCQPRRLLPAEASQRGPIHVSPHHRARSFRSTVEPPRGVDRPGREGAQARRVSELARDERPAGVVGERRPSALNSSRDACMTWRPDSGVGEWTSHERRGETGAPGGTPMRLDAPRFIGPCAIAITMPLTVVFRADACRVVQTPFVEHRWLTPDRRVDER